MSIENHLTKICKRTSGLILQKIPQFYTNYEKSNPRNKEGIVVNR